MAFFLRDDARDDLNARPKGKSMKYQPAINNPIYDERDMAKERASKAMASYENPLHAPTYDPMMAYRANAMANNAHSENNNNNNNNNSGPKHQSPSTSPLRHNNNTANNGGGDTNYRDDRDSSAYHDNGNAPHYGNDNPSEEAHFYSSDPQQIQQLHQQQQGQMLSGNNNNDLVAGAEGGRARGRSNATSIGIGMHVREERPMMASKKMVHAGDDMNRRGNGNILAPPPLSWEESKPKIRGHQRLPDTYLQQIASKDEHVREEQIKNMARCGQENFYKGFSNKPERPVGTHKVPQDEKVVNSGGIGIWGFGGLGKMSEESTGGMRKKLYHLQPLETQESLQNRIAASNNNNNNNLNYSAGGEGSSPASVRSGGGFSPKQQQSQQQQQQSFNDKFHDRPWARPTDLQQQKLQNGFSEEGYHPPNNQRSYPNRSATSLGMSSNNNNNSYQQHQYNSAPSPYRAQPIQVHRDKNASVVSECLNYAHDKSSTDAALRQRQTRYPDPSTVPFTNDVVYKYKDGGRNANARYDGVGPKLDIGLSHHQQGSLLASPPGAKFASRSDTTNGASYLAPRSQTSFN